MGTTTIRTLRCVLAFACACIMIFSCALIISAVITKGTFSKYSAFLYYYGTVMTTLVILGSILSIVIAIWGCYLSYKRSSTPLFATVLSLNLIAHIMLSALYITFLGQALSESVETRFDDLFLTYTENPQPVDYAQKSLKCCGKYEAREWFTYLEYLPASCCPDKLNNETTGCAILDYPTINHNGCIRELETFTNPRVDLMSALFLGLQISEIFTLAIYCWYCWQILKDKLHNKEKRLKCPEEVTHL